MTEGDPTNDPFHIDPEKNPLVDAVEAPPIETPVETEPTGFAMVEEKPKSAAPKDQVPVELLPELELEEELVPATLAEEQESQEKLETVLGILGDEISALAEMAAPAR